MESYDQQAKRRRLGPDDLSGAVPSQPSRPRVQLHPGMQLHPPPPQSLPPFSRPSLHPTQPPQLLRAKAAAHPPQSRPSGPLYKMECVLGKGSFGTVCKASVVDTGQVVAVKTVKMREAAIEVDSLKLLNGCPNVIILLGMFEGAQPRAEERSLNLVMEFMADTLQRIIKHHRETGTLMDMWYVRIYMYQLLRGLASLSRRGVVHRDIKPANLLVDPETHTLKVCDFGTAKLGGTSAQVQQVYFCSRFYRAPEIILSSTEHGFPVDMWSAGCVLAEMLIHQPVFPGKDGIDQLYQIFEILGTPTAREIYAMNPQYDAAVGFGPHVEPVPWSRVLRSRSEPEAESLLSEILQYDPSERPQAMVAMAARLFDELRRNSRNVDPEFFKFTQEELNNCPPDLQGRLLWRQ